MKTEVVLMTPAKAKTLLERNVDNRDIRPSVVAALSDSIRRGEWILSHQGVAFGKSGRLLDGQHRLLAVLETGISVKMQITWDVDDDAFKVMDIGTKRTTSDILTISKSLAAVARFFAVLEGKSTRASITPQYLIPFVKAVEPAHRDLVSFCPMVKRTWSSAAVQAAAVMRMLDNEDPDYVKLTYHSLVHMEFDNMPPIAQALFRQYDSGTARASSVDFFARCLKVFTEENRAMRKIQINHSEAALTYARDIIAREVHGQKKPAQTTAKKPVKAHRNYAISSF